MIEREFRVETTLDARAVEDRLRPLAPWRVKVAFSNGFDTGRLETMEPWNREPLGKLAMILEHAGEAVFKDARVLDIGCNAGYNTITLMQKFGCDVVGIDNNRRNLEKLNALAGIAGVAPNASVRDAHDYDFDPFDVILHLGTLYHLQDPIAAMRAAARNLKPGGRLYLETVVYDGDDPLACKFIYGFGGDHTNFWALSEDTIGLILKDAGLSQVETVRVVQIKRYEGTGLNRTLFCARK